MGTDLVPSVTVKVLYHGPRLYCANGITHFITSATVVTLFLAYGNVKQTLEICIFPSALDSKDNLYFFPTNIKLIIAFIAMLCNINNFYGLCLTIMFK